MADWHQILDVNIDHWLDDVCDVEFGRDIDGQLVLTWMSGGRAHRVVFGSERAATKLTYGGWVDLQRLLESEDDDPG